jgi:hypothetical protein
VPNSFREAFKMHWLRKLTISNRIFLGLNALTIIVGLGLMIVTGPAAPLVLLVVGAVGLALQKLPAVRQ